MGATELPVIQTSPVVQREAPASSRAATVKRKRIKKTCRKKLENDYSQNLRSGFQLAFLVLNLWIGVQFFLWVRFYESGGGTLKVSRPPGVEGWLPIASLMNLKAWALSGQLPEIHPAGVFLLLAFVGVSLLFRKSFCSWLCPIGTLSEALAQLGRILFGRNFVLPRWLDFILRSLKYLLLGLFLYAVGSMLVAAIRSFLDGPYGIIADVKMLNFFRDLALTGTSIVGLLVVASLFVPNFWCRYLCPYGALMGLVSWLSPMRIRRSPDLCIDCGECTKACPARITVESSATVRSPECLGCYQCVAACPAQGALEMSVGRRRVSPAWFAAGIAVLFLGLVLTARLTGHWHTDLPDEVYYQLVPAANQFSHP